MPISKKIKNLSKLSSHFLLSLVLGLGLMSSMDASLAESRRLAPNFSNLPAGAKIVIMPTDIELFSLSAGGIPEPKAEWTQTASKHFKAALLEKEKSLGLNAVEIVDDGDITLAEVNALHGALANAIVTHHFFFPGLYLPTKEGKLDWSMGEAALVVKKKSGADYALFSWVRDSYASAERKITMVLLAAAGIGITGGTQNGYASLIDLKTGQVVWFNRLGRSAGDLREEKSAKETIDALLLDFPVVK